MNPIKLGDIINGSHGPEPIQIDLIEHLGEYVRIVGVTTTTKTYINQLIT